MITNHRYLTNRTFRGMRRLWNLDFPFTRILDLHGNKVVHEVSPLGFDDNVFDIEQGVAIGIFAKGLFTNGDIAYAELWGNRTTSDHRGKYDFLGSHSISSTEWVKIAPEPPLWLFAPTEGVDEDVRTEFYDGLSLHELMPGLLGPNNKPQSGLATMHDKFALSFTVAELEEKIRMFLATSSREQAEMIFGNLCNPKQWDYAAAKRALFYSDWNNKISPIWFLPFDIRYTVYDKAVAVHLRRRLSDHLFQKRNLALVIGESGQEISGDTWDAVSCVNGLLQLNYFRRNGSPTLPLYLYAEGLFSDAERRPNLSPRLLKQLADSLGLQQVQYGLPQGFTPEDIFHYAYAVFHSPTYRRRYAGFLKIDFPRMPLTSDVGLFRALAHLGADLVALHLLEDDYAAASWNRPPSVPPNGGRQGGKSPLQHPSTTFVAGDNGTTLGKFSKRSCYQDGRVYLDTGNRQRSSYFDGVPEDVWNFHIGGYQVLYKWLYDRRGKRGAPGRTLTEEDITHYQRIVVALRETIRLMGEIDAVIEDHGGWPIK